MGKKSKRIKVSDYDIIVPDEYRKSNREDKRKGKKVFEVEKRYHLNFRPKTKNQQIAWQYFQEKPIVILSGSAGTGKCLDFETEIEVFVPDELFDFLSSPSLSE